MSIPQDSEPTALRHRAFIVYRHQDKAWAGWLRKALETSCNPQAAGRPDCHRQRDPHLQDQASS